jgi:hypothetical protein
MGSAATAGQDEAMTETRGITQTGRTLTEPAAVAREARRLVRFERHYRCGGCGSERDSWSRMSACPDCGEQFVAAVIRRAAFA